MKDTLCALRKVRSSKEADGRSRTAVSEEHIERNKGLCKTKEQKETELSLLKCDCNRLEVEILKKRNAYDLLLPQRDVLFNQANLLSAMNSESQASLAEKRRCEDDLKIKRDCIIRDRETSIMLANETAESDLKNVLLVISQFKDRFSVMQAELGPDDLGIYPVKWRAKNNKLMASIKDYDARIASSAEKAQEMERNSESVENERHQIEDGFARRRELEEHMDLVLSKKAQDLSSKKAVLAEKKQKIIEYGNEMRGKAALLVVPSLADPLRISRNHVEFFKNIAKQRFDDWNHLGPLDVNDGQSQQKFACLLKERPPWMDALEGLSPYQDNNVSNADNGLLNVETTGEYSDSKKVESVTEPNVDAGVEHLQNESFFEGTSPQHSRNRRHTSESVLGSLMDENDGMFLTREHNSNNHNYAPQVSSVISRSIPQQDLHMPIPPKGFDSPLSEGDDDFNERDNGNSMFEDLDMSVWPDSGTLS